MKPYIYCCTKAKGTLNFYLVYDREEYYLCSQAYRKGVNEFFEGGVSLSQMRRYDLAHNDTAIIHTMDKLPMYITYVEKEYDIAVLDKTIKKLADKRAA